MMKNIILVCCAMLCSISSAAASQLNLDPYFAVGVSTIEADVSGSKSTSPGFHFIVGSELNWISSNLAAELRLGFGGQYATFNGDINGYTSYLLKPSFDVTRHVNIYGLVGATTTSVHIGTITSNDTSLSYGLGLSYRVPNESMSFLAEWLRLKDSSSQSTTSISGMAISSASVSFVFHYY